MKTRTKAGRASADAEEAVVSVRDTKPNQLQRSAFARHEKDAALREGGFGSLERHKNPESISI